MNPEAEIRRRIGERGAIPFAEFMEVALYWPHGGYYSRSPFDPDAAVPGEAGSQPFGPTGDYYTSQMVHPVFGTLLAVQLYQCWQLLDRPDPFHVVELGSGNGQLCRDILGGAAHLPKDFLRSLRYLCLDRNPHPVPELPPLANQLVADGIPLRGLQGCIISNELLDAFPVHQLRQENGRLKEVFVTLQTGEHPEAAPLVETLSDPSSPALEARLDQLGIRLVEGQTVEINLGLDSWTESVAAALDSGFAITIDYGQTAEELYSAQLRPRGTLVTYHRHIQTDAPLRHVGQQDITAQVDFTTLVNAGRGSGLEPLGYTTQGNLLRNLGLDNLRRRLTPGNLPSPSISRDVTALAANRAGMLALAREDGLGGFKALVQGKGLAVDAGLGSGLWGWQELPSPEPLALVADIPLPLLSDRHISLLQGWGQPATLEFELPQLWDPPGQP